MWGRGTHAGFLVGRDGTVVLGDDLVGDGAVRRDGAGVDREAYGRGRRRGWVEIDTCRGGRTVMSVVVGVRVVVMGVGEEGGGGRGESGASGGCKGWRRGREGGFGGGVGTESGGGWERA